MHALITGTLHRDPVSRTGKTGTPFVTAHLRYRAGQESGWASVIAFAEDARAELLRLREDDVVTVQGEARLGTYTARDGTARPSLEITAAHIVALRQPSSRRHGRRLDNVNRIPVRRTAMMTNSDRIIEAMNRGGFEPKTIAQQMDDGLFRLVFEYLPGEATISIEAFATAAEALESGA